MGTCAPLAAMLATAVLWTAPAASRGQGNFGLGGPGGPAPIAVSARFSAAKDGAPARLYVIAEIRPPWHVYSTTQKGSGTVIRITKPADLRLLGPFQSDPKPTIQTKGNLTIQQHAGRVIWHAPIDLSGAGDPASLVIEGTVRVFRCDEKTCLPPEDLPFTARLAEPLAVTADAAGATGHAAQPPAAATAQPPSFGAGEQAAHPSWRPFTFKRLKSLLPGFDPDLTRAYVTGHAEEQSLWAQILLGFLGGVILNVMPCVLPVIGLKLLSFAKQSGDHRARIFELNLAYAGGIVFVFLALATLAVAANLSWGEQFQSTSFVVVMTAVIFAMALSLLGVWDVPVPGFLGRGKAAELAGREGLPGAFLMGIVTTLLATPCTGPFMASAIAWACRQPPSTTYIVFAAVGLGMASPYLLVGAFPRLIRFLPKPGEWMDTFKHVMGFVLLATVVFMLSFTETAALVPTVGLLFGVWAACWWVGREKIEAAERAVKARAWMGAAAFVGVVWILMFLGTKNFAPNWAEISGLRQIMSGRLDDELETRLADENLEARPIEDDAPPAVVPRAVLIDFTANWCVNCKTLEATVLHTQAVDDALRNHGVATLKADWTRRRGDADEMLVNVLKRRGVPVIAVFSAARPNEPIVFADGYTVKAIIEAIETQAAPK